MDGAFIEERIPHRPPFLFLDRVLSLDAGAIVAEKQIPADWPLFQGHYPGHPLVPGVVLCEAVFQAAALLLAEQLGQTGTGHKALPVLTRIHGAKFKREVGPGALLEIRAELVERLGTAWLFKGSIRVQGKLALQVDFACAGKEA